jgi:predicted nucleic acid-binding protein
VLRVTADSNIYISAMNLGGAPDKLLDMARNGEIVLAISDPIVEEVTHVLRDKFGWTDVKQSNWLRPESPISGKESIRGERSMS